MGQFWILIYGDGGTQAVLRGYEPIPASGETVYGPFEYAHLRLLRRILNEGGRGR
jgi:hypothetical protein